MTAAHYPNLFAINALRKRIKSQSVNSNTDLCIEGFQRSGNSFLVSVVGSWNQDISIASHLHSPAQIKKAIALGIPTLLLIRHPKESIASLITMDENLSIDIALKCYCRFYRSLKSSKKDIIVAPFKTTTKKPHKLIIALNKKTNSSFLYRELKAETIQRIIEHANTNHNWDQAPVPNMEKNKRKEKFKLEIKKSRHYLEAVNLYKFFVN